jgi:hypothetical protein
MMHPSGQTQQVTFGYPEFWKKVYGAHSEFFAAAHELESLANEMLKAAEKGVTEPVEKVVFILVRITTIGFNELMILAGNGAGPGAMKISRGMFESATLAEYLRRNPGEVDDYLQFRHILNWKRYMWLLQSSPDTAKTIRPEKVKELEENYQRAEQLFTDRKGRVRNRWHRKPIAQIAEEIGRAEQYKLPYGYGASIHHGNPEGILAYVDLENGQAVLDAPPSMSWVAESLIGGHTYLLQALDTLNDCAKLGFDEQIKSAVADFKNAWKPRS